MNLPIQALPPVVLDPNIFNTEKTDYNQTATHSLFLAEPGGLFDTVHRNHPEIWEIYKNLKSLDWDELEFDFSTCNSDFKHVPKPIGQPMIYSLAWQWETDSVAAKTITAIMFNFGLAPELMAAWGRVGDNEVLHAATYSEIVRGSFDDPHQVLKEVLEIKESMLRLKVVTDVMGEAYQISHQYALGMRTRDDPEVYDAAFMFTVALLVLERIQFMASFAVTFAIGETGVFMPIAKAVQKICQDEFEVHVALDKAVLKHELSIDVGKAAFARNKDRILALIDEVVDSELQWSDFVLKDDPLVGLTRNKLKEWVLFSAADVYRFFGFKPERLLPSKNPLPYMENWMDMSKTQASPQEQENGQYKVNVIQRNDQGKIYDVDF